MYKVDMGLYFMNEVRDFGVNQFTGKYLTDTGYKDVVQEQG